MVPGRDSLLQWLESDSAKHDRRAGAGDGEQKAEANDASIDVIHKMSSRLLGQLKPAEKLQQEGKQFAQEVNRQFNGEAPS